MEKNWLFPSLQEMSSFKLAQGMFLQFVKPANKDVPDTIYYSALSQESVCEEACDFVEQKVHIPRSFIAPIKQHIRLVWKETNTWILHFEQCICDSHYQRDLTHILPSIVWDSDGLIDYQRTAVKLLTNPNLSLRQRYILMCKYCLEVELQHFWDNDDTGFPSTIEFGDSRLGSYWNSVKEHYLANIPRDNFEKHHPRLTVARLRELCKHEFVAVGYFWNKLSLNEQLHNVQYCACPKVLTSWLRNLSKTDLRQVLMKNFHEILEICTNYRSYTKYIFRLWIIIKDYISEDDFATLLEFLRRKVNKEVEDAGLTTSLLMDIWDSSSDDMKSHVFQYESGRCIYDICMVRERDMNSFEERDDRLVHRILSDASEEFLKEFKRNERVKYLIKF